MSQKLNRFPWVRLVLVILFTIIAIFPFAWMLSNSFMSEKSIFSDPPKFIPDLLFRKGMFDNYRQVIGIYNFGHYILNSILVVVFAAVGQLLVCSISGFAFAKMRFRGRNLLFSLLGFLAAVVLTRVFLSRKQKNPSGKGVSSRVE